MPTAGLGCASSWGANAPHRRPSWPVARKLALGPKKVCARSVCALRAARGLCPRLPPLCGPHKGPVAGGAARPRHARGKRPPPDSTGGFFGARVTQAASPPLRRLPPALRAGPPQLAAGMRAAHSSPAGGHCRALRALPFPRCGPRRKGKGKGK